MKKTHKLLAVVIWLGSTQASAETPRTLASGAPACGNTVAKKEMAGCREVRTLRYAERALETAKVQLARERTHEAAYMRDYLTTPRRLANGAPACGNVMSKDEARPCTEELVELQNARRLQEVKLALARTAKARAQVHEATRVLVTARLEQARETRPQDLALTVSPAPRPPS